MRFENTLTFVRSIKGAPASVLWAFFFTRRAMTALELQEWTGYKGDNLTVALRLLVNLGWLSARSSRGPWCLTDSRQLPLMDESDLIGFPTTATAAMEEDKKNKEVAVAAGPTNPIKSELQEKLEAYGVPVGDNLKACRRYGIGEPMATQISQMKHVTPAFIEAHIKSLVEGEGKGLAILRIKGDELPRIWADEMDGLSLGDFQDEKRRRKHG